MRFKVGDKVKILSKSIMMEDQKWIERKFLNRVGYITGIDGDGSGKDVCNCIIVEQKPLPPGKKHNGWFFAEEDLEFFEGDEAMKNTNKYKIIRSINVKRLVDKQDGVYCSEFSQRIIDFITYFGTPEYLEEKDYDYFLNTFCTEKDLMWLLEHKFIEKVKEQNYLPEEGYTIGDMFKITSEDGTEKCMLCVSGNRSVIFIRMEGSKKGYKKEGTEIFHTSISYSHILKKEILNSIYSDTTIKYLEE